MKTFLKDVVLTLAVKGCLLYLLWFCCVKTIPSYWQNSSDWMLKHSFRSSMSSFSLTTKGNHDDKLKRCRTL